MIYMLSQKKNLQERDYGRGEPNVTQKFADCKLNVIQRLLSSQNSTFLFAQYYCYTQLFTPLRYTTFKMNPLMNYVWPNQLIEMVHPKDCLHLLIGSA